MNKYLIIFLAAFIFTVQSARGDEGMPSTPPIMQECIDYINAGDYGKAITAANLALHKLEDQGETNSMEYIDLLYLAGACHEICNRPAEALSCYKRRAEIVGEALGPDSELYGIEMQRLATAYYKCGDNQNALSCAEKAMENIGAKSGKLHDSYGFAEAIAVRIRYENRDYSGVTVLGEELLDILEQRGEKETTGYTSALELLGQSYVMISRHQEAIGAYLTLLDIYETIYGRESLEYARTLSDLGYFHEQAADYEKAVDYCKQAMEIREKVVGRNHPDYAQSVNRLGMYTARLGYYDEAVSLCKEALDIYLKNFGKEDPRYIRVLSNIGTFYCQGRQYGEAVEILSECLSLLGAAYPEEKHRIFNSLALAYSGIGNIKDAIDYENRAIGIYTSLYGENTSLYAMYIHNLATFQLEAGNYAESIRLNNRALDITKELLGEGHPDYLASLQSLAETYSYIGDYEEAVKIQERVVALNQQLFGSRHPEYLISLNNLGNYYGLAGRFENASSIMESVVDLTKELFGPESPSYLESLTVYYTVKLHDAGIEENLEANQQLLSLAAKVFGTDHPKYIETLKRVALLSWIAERPEEALPLMEEVVERGSVILGRSHPQHLSSLQFLSFMKLVSNDLRGAEKYAIAVNELLADKIRNEFSGMSVAERRLFWDDVKFWYEWEMPALAYLLPTEKMVADAYNATLFAKGILLNSEIEFSEFIRESGDGEALALYESLQDCRRTIVEQHNRPISERTEDTGRLEEEYRKLEHRLLERSKTLGDYTRNMNITWEDVMHNLKEGEVAVEFASIKLNASHHYIAFVLSTQYSTPQIVDLFEDKEFLEIKPASYYRTNALATLVWSKLDPAIKEAETVYFAPDGALFNIAIESLPHYSGEGVMSDHHKLYRLTSTRELAKSRRDARIEKASLFGGMEFGPDIEDLPATAAEVENIYQSLQDSSVASALLLGAESTEDAFKKLSGCGTNLLHVATHGFYWTEEEALNQDAIAFLMSGISDSRKNDEDKAMTRSGLLFTGANTTVPDSGGDGEDGILTAKEISAIDLNGLDLVVLSACQTGLGEITGEGVFGLQRGFKKAGANTLMMSLWSVDDNATRLLMTSFYDNLTSGMSKHDALIEAQKSVREFETKEGAAAIRPYRNPRYWAAFILLDALN